MRNNTVRHLLMAVCLGLMALSSTSCENDDDKRKKDTTVEVDGVSYLPVSFTFTPPDNSPFEKEVLPENVSLQFYLLSEKTNEISIFTTRLDYEEDNVTCQMLVPEKTPLEDGNYQLMLVFQADEKQYPLRLRLTILDHECVDIGEYESIYQELKGKGINGDPYLIATAKDLLLLHYAIEKDITRGRGVFFKQTNYIDLDTYYNDTKRITDYGWPGIAPGFSGTYDGNFAGIDNLMVFDSPHDTVGFFHSLGPGAHVLNITFTNVSISSQQRVRIGAVAGTARDCRIEGVSVAGNIIGGDLTGGLVGEAKGLTIYNCGNSGLVSGRQFTGGFVGKAEGISVIASNPGTSVTSTSSYTGGMIGHMSGMTNTIDNVKNGTSFMVKGTTYTGGLIGYAEGGYSISHVDIRHTATTGAFIIAGTDNTGGLIGQAVAGGENTLNNCRVELFLQGNDNTGGLVGLATPGGGKLRLEGCRTGVNGKIKGANQVGGAIGQTSDFVYISNTTWSDTLRFQLPIEASGQRVGGIVGKVGANGSELKNLIAAANVTGDRTVGGIVGEADKLRFINCQTDSLIKVQGYNTVGGLGGAVFAPEISKGSTFSALVNPGDTCAGKCVTAGGLFGYARGISLDGVTVRTKVRGAETAGGIIGQSDEEVSLTNCVSYGSVDASGSNIGGIVGYAVGSKLTIKDCMNHGDIAGYHNVGGITGHMRVNYWVENARNKGSIKAEGDRAGGITGFAYEKHQFEKCANRGDVNGKSMVGGIVGGTDTDRNKDDNLNVFRCANGGTITGSKSGSSVGGIVGYSFGHVDINESYNTGYHEGNNEVGGIIGQIDGYYSWTGSIQQIKNCNNEGNSSGKTHRGGILGWKTSDANVNSLYVSSCYNTGKTGWGIFGGIHNTASYNYYKVYYSNNSNDFTSGTSKVQSLVLPALPDAAKLDF